MPAERRALLIAERTLFAAAALCGLWVVFVWLQAAVYGREQRHAFEEMLRDRAATNRDVASVAPFPATRALIGILEIPRLGISDVVVDGDDDGTLAVAVGHLPDTPLPWAPGNSALAAHRDTMFKPLERIKIGDEIRLRTGHGDFLYRVRYTWIVEPDDVSVLDPSITRRLTLVTCYPFSYIGSAPHRFIVQADEVASGDTP